MKRLLVTGGSGLVGRAIQEQHPDAIFISSKDYDLRKDSDVRTMFAQYQPTHVIHLAGKVGGVGANLKYPVEFFDDNILMNTLVLKYSHEHNVEKVISFMSTCVFPNNVEYPIQPNKIHLGEPHFSNFGYAYAKRMLEIQTKAYNTQFGHNWFTIIPTNIYGPHDNFHLEDSHVIPALIHKCYLAKKNNTPLHIWGTGKAVREFIHSSDIARLTLWLMDNYTEQSPIILSRPDQVSIKEVVEMVVKYMGFEGEVLFDDTKPEGQERKPSDTTPLKKLLPDYSYIPLEDGLKSTIEWFVQNYNEVRK